MAQLEPDPQPDPNPNPQLTPRVSTNILPTQLCEPALPGLPSEVTRHHLVPVLPLSALRAFRRASRASRDDASRHAIRSIKRAPGTHPLPPDLGARFPCLARLDLSGDSQLEGGLALFRALRSATGLTALSLAGCTALPASFVSRQLVEACPRLQHLALSCCCSAGADTEAAVLAGLAAAPLAASLTSLELHCGGAFQPEIHHLAAGLGRGLTALRVYGSRTLDDAALAELPRLAPALAEVTLTEQHSRRGRHVRGEGLGALAALSGLRVLSLACAEPDARRMAAALATLTQLRELDLSRCEPRLLEALAPLHALVYGGGGAAAASGCGGGALRRLYLPTAYTSRQLERGLPAVFGGVGEGSGERQELAAATTAAAGLEGLRLHASAALPEGLVSAMSRLAGLRELSLSHCGPAGSGAAVAAAAAALTGLTSFRLVQEYGSAEDGGFGLADGDGGEQDGGGTPTAATSGPDADAAADGAEPRVRIVTWYDGLLTWRSLRRLELTDADGFDDGHLYDIGRSLPSLSYFGLSRNVRATGAGFASWPAGCRCMTALALYDCARVGDAALAHVAALPLRVLTLAHLPEVGATGVLRLAGGCTTLRSLTLERLASAPGSALAALWRLPQLEALCLRMCPVNNQTLQMALTQPLEAATGAAPGEIAAAAAVVAPAAVAVVTGTTAAADATTAEEPAPPPPTPPAPAQSLTWLELQGCLVSTAGLWPLRQAAGLTHLDLSNCRSVGDHVAEVLLKGGGRAASASAGGTGGAMATTEVAREPRPAVIAGGGATGAATGVGGGMLIPSLAHVDLRGCNVSEATLERLRLAGLAVNPGTGTWR